MTRLEIDLGSLVCRVQYRSAEAIIEEIAAATGAPAWMIRSRQRHPVLTEARAAAVRALRAEGFSWPEIGRALGGRHHTSVMWLARRCERDD